MIESNGHDPHPPEITVVHRPHLTRLIEIGMWTALSLTVAILVIWWNEEPPIVVLERTLLTPEVRPGEEVRVRNVVKPHKQCPVAIERWLIDSSGNKHLVASETRWPERTDDVYSFESVIRVPMDAFAGAAEYHVAVRWSCNLLQKYFPPTFEFPSYKINITPSEGSPAP